MRPSRNTALFDKPHSIWNPSRTICHSCRIKKEARAFPAQLQNFQTHQREGETAVPHTPTTRQPSDLLVAPSRSRLPTGPGQLPQVPLPFSTTASAGGHHPGAKAGRGQVLPPGPSMQEASTWKSLLVSQASNTMRDSNTSEPPVYFCNSIPELFSAIYLDWFSISCSLTVLKDVSEVDLAEGSLQYLLQIPGLL